VFSSQILSASASRARGTSRAAAEFLPRELRSLGFGYLACANAVGDVVSSLYVGFLAEHGHQRLAFCLAAGFGAAGVAWMLALQSRARSHELRAIA